MSVNIKPHQDAATPTANRWSVVVTTADRPRSLANVLRLLAALSTTSDLPVRIADAGGEIPLEGVIANAPKGLSVQLDRHHNQHWTQATNASAAQVTTSHIAFLGDDCRPPSHWLTMMDRAARTAPDALLGGPIRPGTQGGVLTRTSDLVVEHFSQWSADRQGRAGFLPASNLAVPTERFLAIGGFDTWYDRAGGHDREFSARWEQRGWPSMIVDDAWVERQRAISAREFLADHHHYGRGSRHLATQSPTGHGRLSHPWEFGSTLLQRATRSGDSATERAALVGLTLLSQAATTTGYLQEAISPSVVDSRK